MNTLHLIRHAKSSWADPSLDDEQRPLNKRGRRDTILMAPAIRRAGWGGEGVFCSTACRARLTLEALMAALQAPAIAPAAMEPCYDPALYTFDYNELLHWLSGQTLDELTLVGHNPALHGLVEWLTGEALPAFPTCAYAQLSVPDNSWSDCRQGSASLAAFITPRMLKEGASGD